MFRTDNRSAMAKALAVCKAVADGDFEARVLDITEKGEAGEMLHAINLLIDRTDAYMRESKACLEYVSRNQYFRKIEERGMGFGQHPSRFDGRQCRLGRRAVEAGSLQRVSPGGCGRRHG